MTRSTTFTIKNVSDCRERHREHHADELVEKLVRTACQRNDDTVCLESARNGRVHFRVREETEHQHACEAADAVNAKHVQRIVIAADRFDFGDRRVARPRPPPGRCKTPPECSQIPKRE